MKDSQRKAIHAKRNKHIERKCLNCGRDSGTSNFCSFTCHQKKNPKLSQNTKEFLESRG